MERYFDLGKYTRSTSTASRDAQLWFDRGLLLTYAFNHGEAIRCFEKAISSDAGFGLAHWGVAYAAGPNYNKQWDAFDEVDLRASVRKASEALAAAGRCIATASPVERDLVAALARRYQSAEPPLNPDAWEAEYTEAMAEVYERHPEDPDVGVVFADAIMTPERLEAVGPADRARG